MQIIRQAFKFGVVGIGNTLLSLFVIWVFTKWLGCSEVMANLIGYTVGLINSFLWNKQWTFKSTIDWKSSAMRFLVVFAVCYLLQLMLLLVLNHYYIDRPPFYGFLKPIFVSFSLSIPFYHQMLAMAFYTIINFLINKMYTFKS